MFLLPYPRDTLLSILPSDSNIAEIGVSEGKFSEQILLTCKPNRLLLVDPWVHQEREDYQIDLTNDTSEVMQTRFQTVCNKFVNNENVWIYREESLAMASNLVKSRILLDWIYIDAIHSYQGCTEDLNAWADCIKPDGMIVGHDFALNPAAISIGIDVVRAVRDFCETTEWELVALTNEFYGSYVLMKDPNAILEFKNKIAVTTIGLVDIKSFWQQKIIQELIPYEYGHMAIGGFPVSVFTIGIS